MFGEEGLATEALRLELPVGVMLSTVVGDAAVDDEYTACCVRMGVGGSRPACSYDAGWVGAKLKSENAKSPVRDIIMKLA